MVPEEDGEDVAEDFLPEGAFSVCCIFYADGREGGEEYPDEGRQGEEASEAEEVALVAGLGEGLRLAEEAEESCVLGLLILH